MQRQSLLDDIARRDLLFRSHPLDFGGQRRRAGVIVREARHRERQLVGRVGALVVRRARHEMQRRGEPVRVEQHERVGLHLIDLRANAA